MQLFKTSGIVIRQVNFGESNKMVTVLTRDKGKIQAVARGARKTKNSLMPATQLFCYSNFIFYQGKSMIYINQVELREAFYNLRVNLEKLTYASYLLELVNTITQENEKEEKIFLLLAHTLKHMAYSSDINDDLITLAFQIKLIAMSGYAPHLNDCVSCGNPLSEKIKMSAKMGGILCPQCFHFDTFAMGLNQEARKVLLFLLYQPLYKLIELTISKETIKKLLRIMNTYISICLEKPFHSLNFLKTIEGNQKMNNNY
ncbi:DNA repair protein RecO [Garciella nitratireducens]|uniref:DNA repair protein RecO n=1 Tax=Garciella nitratireducens TaxID=218205 RepID=UPI001BD3EAF5|nr:DNA repair protein RecO [Garciella nitratireducens]